MKSLYVLVLAAGQGTRMKSALPKVAHPVAAERDYAGLNLFLARAAKWERQAMHA